MSALLLSSGVIFVAELGDKSQLMALAFAGAAAAFVVFGVVLLVGAARG